MANDDHIALPKKGVDAWNQWRHENYNIYPDLSGANLRWAHLKWAHLDGANLSGANLEGANLQTSTVVETDLTDADLTGCRIYGISTWDRKLDRAKQQNLMITPENEPVITVDNIEVAQFVYLLLRNQKIRDVIDTITSKVVLILGRFTDERKAVLDALREELRATEPANGPAIAVGVSWHPRCP